MRGIGQPCLFGNGALAPHVGCGSLRLWRSITLAIPNRADHHDDHEDPEGLRAPPKIHWSRLEMQRGLQRDVGDQEDDRPGNEVAHNESEPRQRIAWIRKERSVAEAHLGSPLYRGGTVADSERPPTRVASDGALLGR